MKTKKLQQTASTEYVLSGMRNNFLKLKVAIKRKVILVLATVVLALSFSAPSYASPLYSSNHNGSSIEATSNEFRGIEIAQVPPELEAVKAGVNLAKDVLKVYQDLNPPQEGYVRVLNKLNRDVTLRSYNNNDWLKAIAAGQTYLKAGGQGYITAKTNPLVLLWKRGNYGTVEAFGLKGFGQSAVPKDPNVVFVIGESNTP
ncbi:MAG: hypothetical protein KAF91_02800 [Nostoc sp. TH1S01]|nr:hypothetical protein [Nostoc sp. TH1S01]